ncbi:Cupin domain protein [Bifidobacterium bohemicum]|uniref:Cupin domain protein n=1 Tax=Bifidobacterium bohemicum DSM 22767 TaxID=1437606 RepID=A0A086ZJC7_9BIFI|nr:cupin domain-containing protein [Bifidobacterium bohemicum]KFI46627.1 cupin domain protein [Bifidobacterium bohemicum DSM 22767]SCB77154.1 Cupin domain protein [Bifidobacterium bohemicum]
MSTTFTNPSPFPLGKPNDAYARYFEGQSYLAPLVGTDTVAVSNVTFEAGCTNHWHIHHKATQVLIAVGGRGYYQIEGEPVRQLRPGDVAVIPPETKHWHGASPDEPFSHLAVMVPQNGSSNEWLEPVDSKTYSELV